MRHGTAIGEKMAALGVVASNVELQISIAKFQNNGGEYEVARAILDAAYGKGSEGYSKAANDGRKNCADASLQNDGEKGRLMAADKADRSLPASPSTRRNAGRAPIADKAGIGVPVVAHNRHKPGHAKRGAAAIASIQGTIAKSLFDSTILPDGRRLREIRWSECPGLAKKYRRLSRVFMAVHNVAIPADPNTTLDNLVNEDGLKEIISAVERFNDIH